MTFAVEAGPVTIGIGVLLFLVTIVVAGFLVFRLLRGFRAVRSEFMPLGGKVAFWAALAYTLLPIDALPDPILFDDIGALAAALIYINHLIKTNFPPEDIDELEPGEPL